MRVILSQLTKPVELFVKLAKEIDSPKNHSELTHFAYDDLNNEVATIYARHHMFDVYRVKIVNYKAGISVETLQSLKNLTPERIKDMAIYFKKQLKEKTKVKAA